MKAFASDFDKTLYFRDEEEKIRQSDIDAINAFKSKGNLFGICSGRSLNGIRRDTENKLEYDFFILVSGAYVLDGNENLIFKSNIKKETLYSIHKKYIDEVDMVVHANKLVYSFLEKPLRMQVGIQDPREVPGDIYGISITCKSKEEAHRIAEEINKEHEDISAYVNVRNVDMVNKGISKGNSLLKIKEFYHVDEIYGIGDSYNDIPMLEKADVAYTFPYAPKNMQKNARVVNSIKDALEDIYK